METYIKSRITSAFCVICLNALLGIILAGGGYELRAQAPQQSENSKLLSENKTEASLMLIGSSISVVRHRHGAMTIERLDPPSTKEAPPNEKRDVIMDCTLTAQEDVVNESLLTCSSGTPIPPTCDCSDCDFFTLSFSCPDCCIDTVELYSAAGTCFTACAYLEGPTAAQWVITNPGRDAICEHAPLKLVAGADNPNLCSGGTLALKICGPEYGTVNFKAHKVCDGTYITGYFTL